MFTIEEDGEVSVTPLGGGVSQVEASGIAHLILDSSNMTSSSRIFQAISILAEKVNELVLCLSKAEDDSCSCHQEGETSTDESKTSTDSSPPNEMPPS